jgi:TnpA family transposase
MISNTAQRFTKIWGDGDTSSSDQFFRAGHGEAREPGVNYTHVSDRYAPFHTKVIAANSS